MRPSATLLLLAALCGEANARNVATASHPEHVSVTVYRDPARKPDDEMPQTFLQGFAVISETRTVTIEPGETSVRFEGVADGMVAQTAIVTGLPGGVIEKNRNANILSPAALVDGTLGNRVTITRTNPATGHPSTEKAIVRTRADGGLVLETRDGFEAVRCAGIPESLHFDRVPDGLSAQPVFSVETRASAGGSYKITLTYLASGFDWQANYVARLKSATDNDEREIELLAWLTVANENGQSFAKADLLAVAGKLNIESAFVDMSEPPQGLPLRLNCFPIGSTAAGSPVFIPPPPGAPPHENLYGEIVVTGHRRTELAQSSPVSVAMIAGEEQLGDLKLYRIPEQVDVNAHSLKQVAFLHKPRVAGRLVYAGQCTPFDDDTAPAPLDIKLRTRNDAGNGLGVALPMGPVALFEPTSAGDLLLGEPAVRDYAVGQEVELVLSRSTLAYIACTSIDSSDEKQGNRNSAWSEVRSTVSNANGHAIDVEIAAGAPTEWEIRKADGQVRLIDGQQVIRVRVPKAGSKSVTWQARRPPGETPED